MKRRPKGVEEIIAGLQEGSLDRRTKTAMQFQAVKEALGEDPKAVAKALLRHDVAVYAVINRAILEHVQNKQGEIITEKGELPALVTRDLPKFQGAMEPVPCPILPDELDKITEGRRLVTGGGLDRAYFGSLHGPARS